MKRPTPRSTRHNTLIPDTTPFQSPDQVARLHNADDGIDRSFGDRKPGMGRFHQPRAYFLLIGVDIEPVDIDEEEIRARLQESPRSEEHTSELQSLMRTSYAVFCLKQKKQIHEPYNTLSKSKK